MSVNLSLLPVEEKYKIEIDKQASYLVWQIKKAKTGSNEVLIQREKFKSEDEKEQFDRSVEKYKKVMGIV